VALQAPVSGGLRKLLQLVGAELVHAGAGLLPKGLLLQASVVQTLDQGGVPHPLLEGCGIVLAQFLLDLVVEGKSEGEGFLFGT
jgi:hypothetical protein